MRSIAAVAALVFAPVLSAAYTNLIATSDGSTVYFQIQAEFIPSQDWYALRTMTSGVALEIVKDPLADVSASGMVIASASFADRYCPFDGSTCLEAQQCLASFAIRGPGFATGNTRRPTFVRLDRLGGLAWIDQDTRYCWSRNFPLPFEPLKGLYEASSLRQIAPAMGTKLANERYGRRVMTNRGRALTFAGAQLSWLDAAGVHPIRHIAGAFEAVADTMGDNIVYVESPVGELHWLAAEDQRLGLTGSEPALTDDGRTLAFLAPDGSLQIYDRALGTVRRLGSDTYLTFTLGGGAVFAVTSDNRLVRIDLFSGVKSDLFQPFPEFQSADAGKLPLSFLCPAVCYGTLGPGFFVGRGMVILLRGRFLNQAGWRARSTSVFPVESFDVPVNVVSDKAAWFQVPSNALITNNARQPLKIHNPEYPFTFSIKVLIQPADAACFGAWHADFSRAVSVDDPAAVGEIVHVFLTGLHGVETVPDGVPNPVDHLVRVANPLSLADPGALETVFFGLAPGLVGIQQIDIRVLRASSSASLFPNNFGFGCTAPAVATQ